MKCCETTNNFFGEIPDTSLLYLTDMERVLTRHEEKPYEIKQAHTSVCTCDCLTVDFVPLLLGIRFLINGFRT